MSTKQIGIIVVLAIALWASISVQHNAGRPVPDSNTRDVPAAGIGDFPATAPAGDVPFSVMPRRDSACVRERGVGARAAAVARPAGSHACT
jgi:hypothetical protein